MPSSRAWCAETKDLVVIEDRREAIRWTAKHAEAADLLLVAGKGHETYQIIGDEHRHFDDREELASAPARCDVKFSAAFIADASRGHWDGGEVSADAVAIDTRTLPKGALYVALKGERLDGHDFVKASAEAGAAGCVVTGDRLAMARAQTTLPLLVVEDTLLAMQALAHAHRMRQTQTLFVAVCGSNGKTTTKEMVASVLSQHGRTHKTTGNLNNHIGVPLSLLRLESTHAYCVIEAGMNHPGELLVLGKILEPEHALLTNIQEEHMEGLGSLEAVARAEGEMFRCVRAGGALVFPIDDPLGKLALPERDDVTRVGFGESDKAAVRLVGCDIGEHTHAVYATTAGELDVRLPQLGKHNALNAAGAIAIGLRLGLSLDEIRRGLEQAPLVDRRLRIQRTARWLLLDDCYNANPGSMSAALEVLRALGQGKRKVAVLGDMLELGGRAGSGARQARRRGRPIRRRSLIAMGAHAKRVTDAACAAGLSPEAVAHAPVVAPLLAWLKPRLQNGDVVLVKGSRGMKMERFVEALGGAAGDKH